MTNVRVRFEQGHLDKKLLINKWFAENKLCPSCHIHSGSNPSYYTIDYLFEHVDSALLFKMWVQ